MLKLVQLGLTPELRYQWNPDRNEIDVFAVICDEPLMEWSLGDDLDDLLWKIFGSESLLYVGGCEADRDPDWIVRADWEPDVPLPQSLTGVKGDRVA